jgi:hypothetical protein
MRWNEKCESHSNIFVGGARNDMARYHVADVSIKIASITKNMTLIFNIKREALLDVLKSWAAFELKSPKYSAKC